MTILLLKLNQLSVIMCYCNSWREYGRADKRWAIRDPGVISIEIITVFIGILCSIQLYGVYYKKSWRHVLQVFICTCELYGG